MYIIFFFFYWLTVILLSPTIRYYTKTIFRTYKYSNETRKPRTQEYHGQDTRAIGIKDSGKIRENT